jgi:hypothetical protein
MPDLIRHPEGVPTKVGNHLKYWIPVFTGNPGCARSLRLAPPPFGRPAGVYPDENRGRNDDLYGYRWFMDRH